MLKRAHYFIIVLMFILLITALLTFFISFQIMPPQEEEIPRRSRPVFAPIAEEYGEYGIGEEKVIEWFRLKLNKRMHNKKITPERRDNNGYGSGKSYRAYRPVRKQLG